MFPKRTSRASSPRIKPGLHWGHGGFVPSLSQDLAPGFAEQEHAAGPGTEAAPRQGCSKPHSRDRSQPGGPARALLSSSSSWKEQGASNGFKTKHRGQVSPSRVYRVAQAPLAPAAASAPSRAPAIFGAEPSLLTVLLAL